MNESLASRLRQLIEEERLWHLGPLLTDPSPETLQAFQQVWEELPPPRRQDVIDALVEQVEDHVEYDLRPIFRWLLGDSDPHVRAQAIEGLWEDESPALISPLLYMFQHDPDPHVRAAAATALGRFVLLSELGEIPEREVTPAINALIRAAHDEQEDVEVRRRSLEAVSYIDEPHIRDLIEAAYYHPDLRMQASAVFSMGRNANERWGPLILAELTSPDPELRYEAALAAGELALLDAIPLLRFMAEEEGEDPQIRQAAIEALGRIGGPESERILLRLMEAPEDFISLSAETALDELRFMSDDVYLPPLLDFDIDLDDGVE